MNREKRKFLLHLRSEETPLNREEENIERWKGGSKGSKLIIPMAEEQQRSTGELCVMLLGHLFRHVSVISTNMQHQNVF